MNKYKRGFLKLTTLNYVIVILLYFAFCWHIEAKHISAYKSVKTQALVKQQAFIEMAIVYKNCDDKAFIRKEAERIRMKSGFDKKTMDDMCARIEELIRQYRTE